MALAPKFGGQALSVGVSPKAIHTLELYLDYVCPFSAKMFSTLYTSVFPLVKEKYPAKTYKRLAKLAGTTGVEEDKVFDLLEVSDKPGDDGSLNIGNKVTDDVKLMVKANRLTGVHVTPSILFNGILENSISSSFTPQQWEEWLEKNVV